MEYKDTGERKYAIPISKVKLQEDDIIEVGDKVEAKYRGRSKYYPGKGVAD